MSLKSSPSREGAVPNTVRQRARRAADVAAKRVIEARDWAGPRLDTASSVLANATSKKKVEPNQRKVTKMGKLSRRKHSRITPHESKRRAELALAALRGEIRQRPRRNWSKTLAKTAVVGAVIGTIAAIGKRRTSSEDLWTTPVEPTTAGGQADQAAGADLGVNGRVAHTP